MTTPKPTSLTGTYLLDPERTRLGFAARPAMATKVRGAFETFDGRAYLDFTDPERSSAEVTVDAASLNTHNTRRDKHLRTSDFFDAANHPQITFRSTEVHRLEHDQFRITGELTIKGHTRPVTIDFTCTGASRDPYGNTQAGFQGQATLNRQDWGLSWGGLLVSDKIALELEVAAVKTDAYRNRHQASSISALGRFNVHKPRPMRQYGQDEDAPNVRRGGTMARAGSAVSTGQSGAR